MAQQKQLTELAIKFVESGQIDLARKLALAIIQIDKARLTELSKIAWTDHNYNEIMEELEELNWLNKIEVN